MEDKNIRSAEREARLKTLAGLLEQWTALLSGGATGAKPWYIVADRIFEADMALAQRLRHLPDCNLAMTANRRRVSLTLAGLTAPKARSLAEACRAWARIARAYCRA